MRSYLHPNFVTFNWNFRFLIVREGDIETKCPIDDACTEDNSNNTDDSNPNYVKTVFGVIATTIAVDIIIRSR
jgi:hypothetical protein